MFLRSVGAFALVVLACLPAQAALVHQWTFNNGNADDAVGSAHGTLNNGAAVSSGQLTLDGVNDFVRTAGTDNTITAKTLVAWVSLSNLTQQSGSGLTLERFPGSDVFDGIVYGEHTATKWMNGSDGFNRTQQPSQAGNASETTTGQVMMAITYGDPAANDIKIYRNGSLYASYTPGGAQQTYTAGVTNALMGVRHDDISGGSGTATGNDQFLAASVNEARIYNTALTAGEVATLFSTGPSVLADPTPTPLHKWTFDNGTANDSIGTAHGTLFNGATISGGKLLLDGVNDYARTSPMGENIYAKTLVAWVTLNNLTQRSGSAITLENPTGADTFDGIVYGEGVAQQWMNGSNGFERSNGGSNGGALEASLNEVMMAITYNPDNTISIYRNGVLYATYNDPTLPTYPTGVADVLFGLRHIDTVGSAGTSGGNDPFLAGMINEGRIYGTALSPAQILAIFQAGTSPLTEVPEPASIATWTMVSLAVAAFAWKRRKANK